MLLQIDTWGEKLGNNSFKNIIIYTKSTLLRASSLCGKMEKSTILISKKEYEGMKETIEILQDPEIMSQILESEKNIKAGKIKELKY